MIHLAWGYLCAEDAGADETQRSDSRKNDLMLVTSPRDGQALHSPALHKAVESNRACYKEDGDKHRRKKCINHLCSALPNRPPEGCKTTYVAGPLRCKTGYACRTFLFSPYAVRGEKVKSSGACKSKSTTSDFRKAVQR